MSDVIADPTAVLVDALLARLSISADAATRARLAVALARITPLVVSTADLLPLSAEPLPAVILPSTEAPDGV